MLADDDVLVRQGIRQLLSDKDYEVIDEAGNGKECIEKIRSYHKRGQMPDILILDIQMPEKDGYEVLQHIRREKINLKVLILTGRRDKAYLKKAIQYKTDGYILKNVDFSQFESGISKILSGENYIQPELEYVINSQQYSEKDYKLRDDRIALLTNREKEILMHVASGMLNKEIANCLNITERTVKNHLSGIFRKLEVSDRTQAAVFAIRNHIVIL